MAKLNFRMSHIFSGSMCVRESWIFFQTSQQNWLTKRNHGFNDFGTCSESKTFHTETSDQICCQAS